MKWFNSGSLYRFSRRPNRQSWRLELLILEDRLTPTTFTPAQIRAAYRIDAIPAFGGTIVADGTGQTIAIVDAYNHPNIQADLAAFDTRYGLPAPPSFRVVNQSGGVGPPRPPPPPRRGPGFGGPAAVSECDRRRHGRFRGGWDPPRHSRRFHGCQSEHRRFRHRFVGVFLADHRWRHERLVPHVGRPGRPHRPGARFGRAATA